MELSNYELKLAELSLKKYRRFFYRNSELIGWVGVASFTFGLLRILPVEPAIHGVLLRVGFAVTIWSTMATGMRLIGKLFDHVKNLEGRRNQTAKETIQS